MPFNPSCASESLHKGWGSPGGKLTSKVSKDIKELLLDLAGKSEKIHYTKNVPKFCATCIANAEKTLPVPVPTTSTPVKVERDITEKAARRSSIEGRPSI